MNKELILKELELREREIALKEKELELRMLEENNNIRMDDDDMKWMENDFLEDMEWIFKDDNLLLTFDLTESGISLHYNSDDESDYNSSFGYDNSCSGYDNSSFGYDS